MHLLRSSLRAPALLIFLLLLACAPPAATQAQPGRFRPMNLGKPLHPGDIVYTDSGNAADGPAIFKIEERSRKRSSVASGGHLRYAPPAGVAIDHKAHLIVVNEFWLLEINPVTLQQTVLCEATPETGLFWGVALTEDDEIFVATGSAILWFNRSSGQMEVLCGNLQNVLNITWSEQRQALFATSVHYKSGIGWIGSILEVDPQAGKQQSAIVSEGNLLGLLLGITAKDEAIYVTALKGHNQDFGVGQVLGVDPATREQWVVSEGRGLVRPAGVAVDTEGQLVLADPYTVNRKSRDLYDGAIIRIRIDPVPGKQELILRGEGDFVNPCAIAVVPKLSSRQK